jgi:hypothetical protein
MIWSIWSAVASGWSVSLTTDVVEVGRPCHFGFGIEVALGLFFGRLSAAPGQPPALDVDRRRRDEDAHRIRDQRLDLVGALNVDAQERIAARLECPDDLITRDTRPVAVDLARLEQVAGRQQLAELVDGDEVVVAAIDLVAPGQPRLVGDDKASFFGRMPFHQQPDDGVLAHARRARDDDHHRALLAGFPALPQATAPFGERSLSSTESSSCGSGASARISRWPSTAAISIRHEWRNKPIKPGRTAAGCAGGVDGIAGDGVADG